MFSLGGITFASSDAIDDNLDKCVVPERLLLGVEGPFLLGEEITQVGTETKTGVEAGFGLLAESYETFEGL